MNDRDRMNFLNTLNTVGRQLVSGNLADQWIALADRLAETGDTLTAEEAAGWANLGYLPGEAEKEMARDVTLDDARHIEEQRYRQPAAHVWRDGKRIA